MSHILVLDDVAEAGVLVQKILAKKGHQVVAFTDEDAALQHAANHPLDLVILDIKLKKMSGIAVLEELIKINPAVKAIILTGNPTAETARHALALGAAEYCVKPIDKDELEKKVALALKK
ncbi:MAG: response regulator [Desulfobulbaceae bacterium]|nr:response regulator [Desulfobulbaceae bacterium]